MSDLLNKINSQRVTNQNAVPAEGVTNVTPSASGTDNASLARGTNLLNTPGAKATDSPTASANQSSADTISTSSKSESSGSDGVTVENPDSWTKETSLKEVKKLREENKTYRLKYQETIEQLKTEAEARIQAKEAEMKSLLESQKELTRIKAEQEDRKRSLEEKLAHRESKVTELSALMEAKEKEYQRRMSELETLAQTYQAKEEAEKQIYVSRIDEEVNKIPEKFREIASMIVKGAGDDPRDGLIALNEAKLKGVFEDKTVVVNHSVPGAKDGARASRDRLDEAARESRSKMSSSQKIKSALDSMKSGSPNSAFRTK